MYTCYKIVLKWLDKNSKNVIAFIDYYSNSIAYFWMISRGEGGCPTFNEFTYTKIKMVNYTINDNSRLLLGLFYFSEDTPLQDKPLLQHTIPVYLYV